MSSIDWIGYSLAVAACLALGLWLHRVNKKPAEQRAEELAIVFGWISVCVVFAAYHAGSLP